MVRTDVLVTVNHHRQPDVCVCHTADKLLNELQSERKTGTGKNKVVLATAGIFCKDIENQISIITIEY